jgi:hypothetical protein
MRKLHYLFILLLLGSVSATAQTTRYVKVGGTGDGSSWANASGNLQAMVNASIANSGSQVWVAKGEYKSVTDLHGNITTAHPRAATFVMKNGVAIYGGFAGTETQLSQRNWENNVTILSGDIGEIGSNSDNSYHVVYNNLFNNTAILDGFTITAGNADGLTEPTGIGGGMFNEHGSPTVNNCRFINNYGIKGGGMYNNNAAPTLTNCSFLGNTSETGGGIYNNAPMGSPSSPKLTNCSFSNNTATSAGSGIFNYGSSPLVTNCSFSQNTGNNSAGGMYNLNNNPTLTNCIFWGNTGAAVYNNTSNATLTNCSFSGNTIGISNLTANPTLTNCILWDNTAIVGSYTPVVSYSIVKGGYTGTGNLDQDPKFINAASGDLRLLAGSPAINSGNNAALPAGVTTDLDGNTRIKQSAIDMGAYETEYDVTRPTVTINQAQDQADPTNNSSIKFTVVFSEPVTGFGPDDVTFEWGQPFKTYVSGGGTTYTVNVIVIGQQLVVASVAAGVAIDAEGNSNEASTSTDNSVTYDNSGPYVEINQAITQDDPTRNTTVNFSVEFSESVTGFTDAAITLSGTAEATTAVVTETTPYNRTKYNVAVSGMAKSGTVVASIAARVVTDASGNTNSRSISTDNEITFIKCAAPTITTGPVSQSAGKCSSDPVSFSVGATGDDLSYQWSVDGMDIGLDQATLSYNPSSLAVGPHTIQIDITGTCGSAYATATLTIGADQQPLIACPVTTTNVNRSTTTGNCTYTASGTEFNATATDDCGVTSLTCTLSGATTGSNLTTLAGKVFNKGVTTVTWTVNDGVTASVTCSFTVTVVDNQAPVINTIVNPIILLWSPNHKYQNVKATQFVTSVTDNCGAIAASNVMITKVTSDEPDNAPGMADGNTTQDIRIGSTCKTVDLRSERIEGGNGRVYTIYLQVKDGSGNIGVAIARAVAPANQSGTTAVDNGVVHTVNSTCGSVNVLTKHTAVSQVEKIEDVQGLKVQALPNPSTTYFTLILRGSSTKVANLQIADMAGRIIEGRNGIAANSVQHVGHNYRPGVYYAQLIQGNRIITVKLLKQ